MGGIGSEAVQKCVNHAEHAPYFVIPAVFKPESRFFAGVDSGLKAAGMTRKRILRQPLSDLPPDVLTQEPGNAG